ncbi:C-C motif chemokine 14 [Piliocolobus tephrosceles]|uniref:C-C motif chemokine 14 n=1 Tax=Piliocolobus tephrosceles TaxID=591936 RepID=UPI000C29BE9A|nr:C-C motif chemokine 14 [Piliocolobus tephrosceles]
MIKRQKRPATHLQHLLRLRSPHPASSPPATASHSMNVSLVAISFFLLITIALGTKTESSSQTGGKQKVFKIQLKLAGPANSMAFNQGPLLSIRCSLLGGTLPQSECCLNYTTHKIPHQRIMDYYETNSQCSKPGIVFITKRGHSICTNPRDKWVQDYIKHMEEN